MSDDRPIARDALLHAAGKVRAAAEHGAPTRDVLARLDDLIGMVLRLSDATCAAEPPADPAALLRAAIAKAATRAQPYDFAGLLTLAQALEAVGRFEARGQPSRTASVGLMSGAAMRLHSDDAALARVIALSEKWRSRDTADQWAPNELTRALRGEDPSDG